MYRLLLLLYPSSFRAEYGEEMCRDFARKRRQASGFFALAELWPVAIGDAIRIGLAGWRSCPVVQVRAFRGGSQLSAH